MTRLLLRTAVVNLRSRPLHTALVALIILAASATLAPAVSLRAGAADPYNQLARATNAADVHLFAPSDGADLTTLAHARGVRASEGPYQVLGVRIRSRPSNLNIALEGVGAQPLRIDRPKVTDGRWLSGAPGEIVVDRRTAHDRFGRWLALQLNDRSQTAAFVDGLRRRYQPDQLNASDWRDDRQDVTDRTSTPTVVLGSASLAALLAVGLIIANAIGGR